MRKNLSVLVIMLVVVGLLLSSFSISFAQKAQPRRYYYSPHSARVIFNYNIFHTPSPSMKEFS